MGIILIRREIWKTINRFPNYEVSNYGKIRRKTIGRLRTPQRNLGYFVIGLRDKNYKWYLLKIHRLVAEAFIGSCPEGYQCNHKDGNKLNKFYLNLEWVSQSENTKHSYNKGLQVHGRGEDAPNRKLTWEKVRRIRWFYSFGVTRKILSDCFDISPSTIHKIIRNMTWKEA